MGRSALLHLGEVHAGDGLAQAAHLDDVKQGARARGRVCVHRDLGHPSVRGRYVRTERGRHLAADLCVTHLVPRCLRGERQDDGIAPHFGELAPDEPERANGEVLLSGALLPARADHHACVGGEAARVELIPRDVAGLLEDGQSLPESGSGTFASPGKCTSMTLASGGGEASGAGNPVS